MCIRDREYFVGYQSLIREIHRTPLGQAVAGGGGSVAILGEKRLDAALPHHIIVKNVIHDLGDVFEYIPVADEVLVVLGVVCNIEIISLAGIVLGIDPIEGEADLRADIGPDGGQMCIRDSVCIYGTGFSIKRWRSGL